jgi:hypothetical protein
MSLEYVTITGTFNDGSGAPVTASPVFTPSQVVLADGIPAVTPATPVEAVVLSGQLLNADRGPLELLATGQSGLTVQGSTGFWFWTVSNLPLGMADFSFFLPSSPGTVDITALINSAASGGGGDVSSVFGRTGAVVAVSGDYTVGEVTGAAPLASPALSGTPTAPTATALTDDTQVATTAYADAAVGVEKNRAETAEALLTPLTDVPLSLTFTFGSSGAAPSSGTYTAGITAIDQNGVQRVCTVSGSPGTWRRVGAAPWQFFADDYGAKGDGVKCLVTVNTSSATITASAPAFTSTGVDGGKNIMICGGGGSIPGGPDIDTIATVIDSTHAVLTSGAPAGPNGSGLACVFSSDDRVAVDNCVQAAAAYALAHNYVAQVIFSDRIYGLGANMFQSQEGVSGATLTYNTQVRLPVPTDQTGESGKLEIQLLGAGESGHCQSWMSTNSDMPGTALVSYSVGPNSTPSPTFGWQSIVGAPSAGSGTVTDDSGFFNAKAVVRGLTLVQPGWSNSIGLDCLYMNEIDWDGITSTVLAPSTTDGGGVNPYTGWYTQSFWLDEKIGAGFRLPATSNNDQVTFDNLTIQGLNIGILGAGDHIMGHRVTFNSVDKPFQFGVGGSSVHAINLDQVSFENCNNCITVPTGTGTKIQIHAVLDGENASIAGYDISDPNNNLYGTVEWGDTLRTGTPIAPSVNGAANLRIVNNVLQPGPVSSPTSPPSSTDAWVNNYYRDAEVTLSISGGTLSALETDSVAEFLPASCTLYKFIVPGGHTYTPTYTGTLSHKVKLL